MRPVALGAGGAALVSFPAPLTWRTPAGEYCGRRDAFPSTPMKLTCPPTHLSRLWLAAALLAALGVLPRPAAAQYGPPPAAPAAPPFAAKSAQVTLLANAAAVAPGQPLTVGLHFKLAPGWHTYWLNPGYAGGPAKVKWTLPRGWRVGELQFPAPERIATPIPGVPGPPPVSYGYSGEVLLLAELTPPRDLAPGVNVRLEAKADWYVCSDEQVCEPGKATLALELPVAATPAPAASPETAALFARFTALLPKPPPAEWEFIAQNIGHSVRVMVGLPESHGEAPVETEEQIPTIRYFPLKAVRVEEVDRSSLVFNDRTLMFQIPAVVGAEPPKRLTGLLVIEKWPEPRDARVLAIDLPSPPPTRAGARPTAGGDAPAAGGTTSLLGALALAFLGGLLLNLMPCVLPVLSLKVLGFVEQARAGGAAPWRHGVAYTAGVLVSFLGLAGLLLALRASGQALGWGFQLQEPAFVVVTAVLLFLIALNLFGVFEVGVGLMGLAGGAGARGGLGGSFLTGVLATVVATPCIAPFMGTALAYALAAPAAAGLVVFASLALGLAAPYLVLAVVPGLLRFVPRPGAWMETFKHALGFPMLAVVVWLLGVLGKQTDTERLLRVVAGLLIVAAGAWVLGHWATPVRPARTRWLARGLALLALAAGLVFALRPPPRDAWEPFSPARLAELRAAGTPVFVDFTAAWCVTCRANETFAFTAAVYRAMAERGIVPLRADWTKQDPVITEALAGYGKTGVPYYVLYGRGPNAPPEPPLGQVLTPGKLLEAFARIPPPTP